MVARPEGEHSSSTGMIDGLVKNRLAQLVTDTNLVKAFFQVRQLKLNGIPLYRVGINMYATRLWSYHYFHYFAVFYIRIPANGFYPVIIIAINRIPVQPKVINGHAAVSY